MPVTVVYSNQATEEARGEPPTVVAVPEDVPAWLAARRERQAHDVTPVENSSAESRPLPIPPALPKATTSASVFSTTGRTNEAAASWYGWLVGGLLSQGMIGVAVSLLVHAIVLLVLACFLVSQVTPRDVMNLWGVIGDSDQAGSDLILDTELPLDGGESAPLQMSDMSQALESLGPKADFAESMRVGLGGKGVGEGSDGNGTSMHVAGLKIPGHAQTKGSFSAWADPRDPKPGENYFVVIQIRLPGNVTKFRGSDISGNVIGTDSYRQAIRFKSTELFPIENGTVELRIHVPGAARLVRDTIRVESKILREKQTFEIEF